MKNMFKKLAAFSLLGKLSVTIILLVLILGIFAPLLASFPYDNPSGKPLERPSKVHWLGTDDLGIDLWAQICQGARISLLVGLTTAAIAGIGGGIIGIIAGYAGGVIDGLIMRIVDIVIVLPDLALMIVISAFWGPSFRNIVIVLAIFSWTHPARIVRAKIISIKQEKYITVSKSFGADIPHLLIRHFLPATVPLLVVSVVKIFSRAIVAEASLAFLGLGDPTMKSWGLILNHAINFKGIYFTDYWKWWVISPTLAISSVAIAVSYLYKELEHLILRKQI